jgi:type I restriction enzyme M protein
VARRRKRAESRARYYIREEAGKRGWRVAHIARGGDCLEENEILTQFPDIGLGLERPDFVLCMDGDPAVVVEAKNEADKLQQAVEQAIGYADTINATGRYAIRLAVGAAGEQDAGFMVEPRYLTPKGWMPFTANGHALTTIPSRREVELGIAAGDATTSVSIPDNSEFVDAAIEISALLRSAKIEAPLRPKVIGAIVTAMYAGAVDTAPGRALDSVNSLVEKAIGGAVDMPRQTKDQLIDALRLSRADFGRVAPSIRRVVSILRRLNVRIVLQSDTDFLGMFYEAFLRYGYDNTSLGIVFTPRHITRFCVELVGAGYADRVIDVAAGTGGFLVAAFDRMLAPGLGGKAVAKVKSSLAGYDTNPTVWALAMLNMFFRGDGKSQLHLGSCLTKESRDAVAGKFTRAFLNPPFSQVGEPEREFIDAAMDALEPGGMLAAVVHAGVFADSDHRMWRASFLRRHTLVGMVSLPEDLFYPTAAPTTILIARAHFPQADEDSVVMAKAWNDGFAKLKSRRVQRPGSQLPEVRDFFAAVASGRSARSDLATVVAGRTVTDGVEWSPEQWLPQPRPTAAELREAQEGVLRSIYQAVARFPDLADEALDDFGEEWSSAPDLPLSKTAPIRAFFSVSGGGSAGERNYVDGEAPYVSSGDASNSVVRLVAPIDSELVGGGGISVTAFGTASLQPWPFLARGNGGSAVRVLTPRYDMSTRELIWFVAQINRQRWRFNYARMAIKGRLGELAVKSPTKRLPDIAPPLADNIRHFRDTLNEFSVLPRP